MTVEQYAELYEHARSRAQRQLKDGLLEYDCDLVDRSLVGSVLHSYDDYLTTTGGSPAEIEQVRVGAGGWIPESFEAYLRCMGREHPFVELGVDCRIPAVLKAREAYNDWLTEVEQLGSEWYEPDRFQIPADAYILGHHGGGYFLFLAEWIPDPTVWWMMEGRSDQSGIGATSYTFSQLVVRSIEAVPARALERLDRCSRRAR